MHSQQKPGVCFYLPFFSFFFSTPFYHVLLRVLSCKEIMKCFFLCVCSCSVFSTWFRRVNQVLSFPWRDSFFSSFFLCLFSSVRPVFHVTYILTHWGYTHIKVKFATRHYMNGIHQSVVGLRNDSWMLQEYLFTSVNRFIACTGGVRWERRGRETERERKMMAKEGLYSQNVQVKKIWDMDMLVLVCVISCHLKA